jgi:hypothetical protein
VNPGQYKVAGRERQGEDVVHDLHKARLTQSQSTARRRTAAQRSAAARKAARTRARNR